MILKYTKVLIIDNKKNYLSQLLNNSVKCYYPNHWRSIWWVFK